MLEDEALRRLPSRRSRRACRPTTPGRRARCRDRRLRGRRGRVFPRPRRRPQGHPRPGADALDRRRRRTRPARRHPLRRGPRADPLPATDWSHGGGIALTAGSPASHVAMLARSRGVPMVVGLGRAAATASGTVLVDAEHGGMRPQPRRRPTSRLSAARRTLSRSAPRARPISSAGLPRPPTGAGRVQVNIAEPSELDTLDIATCDGIGLVRTEFLFGKGRPARRGDAIPRLPQVLEWAGDKPVTIRTLDAGGDKPMPGFTVEETNPFLGLRGVRLSLARPEIFRVQLRALLRAAVHGNVKVMLPMVTVPDEMRARAALFARRRSTSTARGVTAQDAAARHHGRGARRCARARPSSPTPTSSRSARTTSRNTSWPRRATTRRSPHLNTVANPACCG